MNNMLRQMTQISLVGASMLLVVSPAGAQGRSRNVPPGIARNDRCPPGLAKQNRCNDQARVADRNVCYDVNHNGRCDYVDRSVAGRNDNNRDDRVANDHDRDDRYNGRSTVVNNRNAVYDRNGRLIGYLGRDGRVYDRAGRVVRVGTVYGGYGRVISGRPTTGRNGAASIRSAVGGLIQRAHAIGRGQP